MSNTFIERKTESRRLILKSNGGSLTPEREKLLKEKINDPNYITMTIEKLADSISQAFSEGYLADHVLD